MTDAHRSASFTPAQQASLDARTADQDRTLTTMHQLEAALAAPAPGNEVTWLHHVRAALEILADTTRHEHDSAGLPDSLLSDIKRTQPILASRVRGVRAQYRQVRDAISSLQAELERDDRHLDYSDTRQRIAWILTALRHQRARESDLIYEAYFDAFRSDLEAEATP